MLITFSGVDGSGKTTIGKLLAEGLKKRGFDITYKVEFKYFLLGYLKKFVNIITRNKKTSDIMQRKVLTEKSYPLIIGKLWVYLTFFDLLLEFLYFKIFCRNRIIVMDRCIYDFLVGWQWIGYSDKFIKWLYLRFPHYDLSYILDIDPHIAYERKKEEQDNDLYFFTTFRNMYLEIYKKDKRIILLNTKNDKKSTLKKIINDINRIK